MSTWHVLAVERLGAPDPSWPTIYGPASGEDPIAANGLRSLDLTLVNRPLENHEQELERNFLEAGMGNLTLRLADHDGSVAESLGPRSSTLATEGRYFGPWVLVEERWSIGETNHSAVRFTGYLDEINLTWDEADQVTTGTAIHASNLLKERILSDFETLKRPWPAYPEEPTDDHAVLGHDILEAASAYSFSLTHAERLEAEQALWVGGSFSWVAGLARTENPDPTEGGVGPVWSYDPPSAPAPQVVIGGEPYAVESIAWGLSVMVGFDTFAVATVRLAGAPDLTLILSEGTVIEWPLSEAALSYYTLAHGVPEPASGQDGPSYLDLTSVDHLVEGDKLSIAYREMGKRKNYECQIIDLDGTINRAWLTEPINQAIPGAGGSILRVRRDNRDPVLVDGVAYARRACAPWTLDTSQLLPAAVDWPVLSWMPVDTTSPALYGIIHLQNAGGEIRISRRGSDGTVQATGVWQGPVSGAWTWSYTDQAVLDIYGDDRQWPGATPHAHAMMLYTEGGPSSVVPVNGWRRLSRSLSAVQQGTDAVTWTISSGSPVYNWSATPTTTVIPSAVIAYSSTTEAGQGYWARSSSGAWTWTPYGGSATSVSLTGSPSGSWLALGMGMRNGSPVSEVLLGLVVSSNASTYSSTTAVMVVPDASGNLTVLGTRTLTVGTPGVWALGGGLAMCVFPAPLGGKTYPHTRLWLVKDPSVTPVETTLPTLEVCPGTVQPLSLVGGQPSGWMFLAIETYEDDAGEMARRARLVKVGADLRIVNGEPEANPTDPTNPSVRFRRGVLVQDPVPAGVLTARMVRTGVGDEMLGILGGRLFSVANRINTTLERIQITDLSAMEYLELLGKALLATAVPRPDGSLALVSRAGGTLRGDLQDANGALEVTPCAVWFGKARVTYQDPIQGSKSIEVSAVRQGGKIFDLDLGKVVSGAGQAYAQGSATASFWGTPRPAVTVRIVDVMHGVQSELPPPAWSEWSVGDRVPFTDKVWKITKITHELENREAELELVEMSEEGE